MELIERVARVLAKADRIEICSDAQYRHSSYGHRAHAAVEEVLDVVEAHLSAVQYDPAPYTALKHRLAALRDT